MFKSIITWMTSEKFPEIQHCNMVETPNIGVKAHYEITY